ncbi:MAG: MFS transporter [Candidatus Riflebacteria bacterium]|nr:MFS transporter [Candidatus Riflebacteria bacterium]
MIYKARGFWALVVTQMQSVFNDHAFKNMLLLLMLHATIDQEKRNLYSSIIPAIFIAPFILFSMPAGRLADRLSKRTILLFAKFAEIGIMLLGAAALASGDLHLAVAVLFLTGTQAAFFGPSKYGIIPEIIPEKWISWANGIIELTTFTAIILGTFAGSLLKEHFSGTIPLAMVPLVIFSIIGVIAAFFLPDVPAAAPDEPRQLSPYEPGRLNPFAGFDKNFRIAYADRVLWLSIMGNTFFWFLSGLLFTNIPVFGLNILKLPDVELGTLMVALAFGIGSGSWAAGYLSGNKIEYGLIPLGAIMISFFSVDLAWFVGGYSHALIALTLLGLGGGFFAVPINSLIQHRPEAGVKGGIQGFSYFLTNIGLILSSACFYLLTIVLHLSPPQVFLTGAVFTVIATSYAVWLLPDSLLRLILWILTHTLYNVDVDGRDNIPDRGGALFIANHMSFIDALFVIASTDRFVRFIMAKEYYDLPWINPIARMMRIIPIAGDAGIRALLQSLREASRSIVEGDVVCIFAEGQMSRTGQLLPFRRGFEKIMRGVDAPIIPIHLDRIWGSIFSFEGGRFFWKWPRRVLDPVTVSYGSPLPASTTAPEIRQVIQEIAVAAFSHRKNEMQPLHHAFISETRRHPRRFAMADGKNEFVSYRETLIRSLILAEKLREVWANQEMVGLLMPSSVAGATLNIAALISGRIPVNINFTASESSVASAIAQCGIKSLITSRAFLEKLKVKLPFEPILLEDIAEKITSQDKLRAFIKAVLYPISWIERAAGSTRKWTMNDLATVIFSSGSTGDPKGVMLSHYNIFSNFEGIAQVLRVDADDSILGILPFFHSFGFTGTLWFPLLKGFGVIYHPNPIDARIIGALTAQYKATILLSTPTFLQAYIRRITPEQFGSLRYVIVGAEKLTEKVANTFEDTFGIRPFEAYGCTELSPAVTLNIPGFRAPGFYQVGGKRGRIGHPLPGVALRIVDPDTKMLLPPGKSGLLLVKGPNVMLGYLGNPTKTAEVIVDGWYNTGDMASVDNDGFVTITDRLSRFAKIGGEMVPLMKVEEVIQSLCSSTTQAFAIVAVPDERKGERLVVLHTLGEEELKAVIDKLPGCGLPNLWIPRPDAFRHIDAIPILGTGKTDLRRIKELAIQNE